MTDLNTLPVPPEFVLALLEIAEKTATDYLAALGVPAQAIELVRNIAGLGYYLESVQNDPTSYLIDRKDRFDIEQEVLDSLKNIAWAGGTFRGASFDITPREIPIPVKVKVRK